MKNDTKILIAAVAFTFLLIVGLSFWFGGKEEKPLAEVAGVMVSPEEIVDLGRVPIDGGIVTREYQIKNETGQTIKLKKITTSCMCTEAKVVTKAKETRFFGMEHPTDKNPPVNLKFEPGETAKVVVNYDPAVHGPQGVGPFERMVWLTFSDPAGIKEIRFRGVVVK